MSEALEQLIVDWQGPIYNLALRRLGNEADAADITQDVFLQILRHRDSVEDPARLRAWIYRVAHNAINQRLRDLERRRRKTREKAAALLESPAPPDVSASEEQARVKASLNQLDDEFRAALILRYYQGLSQREIGEVLGLPRTTIQSRLERGLRRLRSQLVGAPMALPAIEEALACPRLPVPERLRLALNNTARLALSKPAAGVIAAGAVMKSKLLGAGIALAAAGLFVGAGLSRSLLPAGEPAAGELRRLRAENLRLHEERSRLQEADALRSRRLAELSGRSHDEEALAEARRRWRSSEQENQGLRQRLAALEERRAAPPGPRAAAKPAPSKTAAPALAERIRGMADMIGDIQAQFEGLSEDELDAEQRAALERVQGRFSEAAGPLLQDLPVLADKILALAEGAEPSERARLLKVLAAFADVLPADQKAVANRDSLALLRGGDPLSVKLSAAAVLRLNKGSEEERQAVGALIGLLTEDQAPGERQELVRLLGQLSGGEAQRALFELALDRRESDRLRSRALGQLQAETLGGLTGFRALLEDPQAAVRQAAVDCLGAALGRSPARPLLALLEGAMKTPDEAARRKIFAVLETRGDGESLARLQQLANDPLVTEAIKREARVAAERLAAVLDRAARGG